MNRWTNYAWAARSSMKYVYWRTRCELLQRLIPYAMGRKTAGRAEHIANLEQKIAKLRYEVREMQVAAEQKNNQLLATNLIIRCTGCSRGGPPEPERVTEEVVREVEVVAHRLREWWTNERGRNGAKP